MPHQLAFTAKTKASLSFRMKIPVQSCLPAFLFTFIFLMAGLSSCKLDQPLSQRSQLALPPVEEVYPSVDSIDRAKTQNSEKDINLTYNQFFYDSMLVNLIDEALANNLDAKIAMQRIAYTKATILQQNGALLPQVNAAASAGITRYGFYTQEGIGNYDAGFSDNLSNDEIIPEYLPDFFVGLTSRWEIDIWHRLREQRKGSYSRLLANEEAVRLIKTNIIADVATLYYQLLSLDYELEIIDKNIALQERAVDLISTQKTAGRVTELAVKQFKAQLLNTKGLRYSIRQQVIEKENLINNLLGRFPQPVVRGDHLLDQRLPALSISGVKTELLLNRPDIREIENRLTAADADIYAARAAFYPSLVLSGSAGLQSFDPVLLLTPESVAFNLLAGLSAPVFNRKGLQANFNRRKAEQVELVYEYERTIYTAYEEVINNLSGIDNYRKFNTLKQQQADELQAAVATANNLFLVGYATYLEVVTSQQKVFEAELELGRVREKQFNYVVGLYRAVGGGVPVGQGR